MKWYAHRLSCVQFRSVRSHLIVFMFESCFVGCAFEYISQHVQDCAEAPHKCSRETSCFVRTTTRPCWQLNWKLNECQWWNCSSVRETWHNLLVKHIKPFWFSVWDFCLCNRRLGWEREKLTFWTEKSIYWAALPFPWKDLKLQQLISTWIFAWLNVLFILFVPSALLFMLQFLLGFSFDPGERGRTPCYQCAFSCPSSVLKTACLFLTQKYLTWCSSLRVFAKISVYRRCSSRRTTRWRCSRCTSSWGCSTRISARWRSGRTRSVTRSIKTRSLSNSA